MAQRINSYTVTYRAEKMAGEPGWSYRVSTGVHLVTEGWTRGSKADAETEAREAINAREALRAAARLAS